ncbi:hypothetical protein Cantr_07910 [Candida viswanathii]|uniref:Uncharacterized protein n=1 Tax=Candida viswanathii TaxID=5486 RepID=A0A367Y262_9ASCO|nr:hypothetical protein Cantr_07910 [Candida viswanathii]
MVLLKSSAANMACAESRNMLPRVMVIEQQAHEYKKSVPKNFKLNQENELKINPLTLQSVDGATLPKAPHKER